MSFSPAKHRSTLIDSEVLPGASRNKVLQGTSDAPAALSTLPGRLAAPSKQRPGLSTTAARSSSAKQQPKRRVVQGTAGKTGAAADATEDTGAVDAVSCTIYQSDFAATAAASTHMLTHSPTRVAAARRILESSSEWAEINRLQGIQAQQQVSAVSACLCVCVPCSPVLSCGAAGLPHSTHVALFTARTAHACHKSLPELHAAFKFCTVPFHSLQAAARQQALQQHQLQHRQQLDQQVCACLGCWGAGVRLPARHHPSEVMGCWGAGMPWAALYNHRQPRPPRLSTHSHTQNRRDLQS